MIHHFFPWSVEQLHWVTPLVHSLPARSNVTLQYLDTHLHELASGCCPSVYPDMRHALTGQTLPLIVRLPSVLTTPKMHMQESTHNINIVFWNWEMVWNINFAHNWSKFLLPEQYIHWRDEAILVKTTDQTVVQIGEVQCGSCLTGSTIRLGGISSWLLEACKLCTTHRESSTAWLTRTEWTLTS